MKNIVILGSMILTVVLAVVIKVPVTQYGEPSTLSIFELWLAGIQDAATLESAPHVGPGESALARILGTGVIAFVLPLLPTALVMALMSEGGDFMRNPKRWMMGFLLFVVIAIVVFGVMLYGSEVGENPLSVVSSG